ncbi:hypothetical protein [Streptomyces sp. NPDC003327]
MTTEARWQPTDCAGLEIYRDDLGTVALGRTAFGVLLVLAYGLGMAATLTLARLLLLHVKHRIKEAGDHSRLRRLARTATRIGPVATSTLVVVVGLGLAARALTP